MKTPQIETWTGEFGREYTDRNALDVAQLDAFFAKNYGVTRTVLNQEFLSAIPKWHNQKTFARR